MKNYKFSAFISGFCDKYKNDEIESITRELVAGLKIFDKHSKFISVFGSARVGENDPDYIQACNIGAAVAEAGFAVVTGGGPGIMEAAAKGAFLRGGDTYGINVSLPHEQGMNPYIKVPYLCEHLFTRKILLIMKSSGFVVLPGGFGTLDELFEIVTLITTGLIKPVPVILAGEVYWKGLWFWMKEEMLSKNFITEKELEMMTILDDPIKIIGKLSNS